MQAHLTGTFPRSEQLVEITRAAERGKASQAELEDAFRRDLQALVELQSNSNLDYVVDGQLNWHDLFRPFAQLFKGIELGGLTRWFDNNTFYRRPIIEEKIRFSGNSVEQYFRSDLIPRGVRKKAILPGPFTFARMSQNEAYSSLSDLVDDLAHALKDTIVQLCRAGYDSFQFNEPCLCSANSSEVETAKHAIELCVKACPAKTTLHTYFGDAGPNVPELLDFSVDCIGLDFYATSIESIQEHDFDKELGCGCVDGRNSLLESSQDLLKFISRVAKEVEPKELYLCPNCDLEFLPYSVAEKKVRVLAEAKELQV